MANFQINRSYIYRIRKKSVCCIQFYGKKKKKKNCWFTIVGVIFCRGFIENKFALTPSVGWLCWGLTSQSTIFQSCRDGAIASWVINQYFRGVKCLAQGHNTAAVGLEPRTSRSGVRHSTTEPPRSPDSVCMCEERYHATVCVAVRKCFKIDIFIQHYVWNVQYSTIGSNVQPANQLVKIKGKSDHNFWTVQDSLMKYHRWAYLINLCLIDTNTNIVFLVF